MKSKIQEAFSGKPITSVDTPMSEVITELPVPVAIVIDLTSLFINSVNPGLLAALVSGSSPPITPASNPLANFSLFSILANSASNSVSSCSKASTSTSSEPVNKFLISNLRCSICFLVFIIYPP